MKMKWYLIRSNYGKVGLSQKNLEALGVECFSPKLSPSELHIMFGNKKKFKKEYHLFSPYIFVKFNVSDIPISKIQHTVGVKGFVRFGASINPIPNSVAEKIINKDYFSGLDKDVIKLIRCDNENLRGEILLSIIDHAISSATTNNLFR
jgi:transcription antitermination factor NusG